MAISSHEQYQIWLQLVRQKRALTNDEFIEAFPDAKEKAEAWIDCIDENGNPYLDPKKFRAFVDKKHAEKRLRKQKVQGKKGKKQKF